MTDYKDARSVLRTGQMTITRSLLIQTGRELNVQSAPENVEVTETLLSSSSEHSLEQKAADGRLSSAVPAATASFVPTVHILQVLIIPRQKDLTNITSNQ